MATEPLYQIVRVVKCESYPNGNIIDVPIYELVEPCVHGRIDAHWGPHYVADANGHDREYREWCKGAMPGGV